MKKTISVLLVVVLCLGAFAIGASAAANPFTDVPSSQWYYHDVINAYTMGLINGKTETTFEPDDNLTYAETVKLAACMHQKYFDGKVTLKNGDPWYQTYVDYCHDQNIISKNYTWNSAATRAGYIEIFANALPTSALKEINVIEDGIIPDVSVSHPQAAAIYKLYRAGVVQGTGTDHYCNPSESIKRSEVAAILTRMMDADKRVGFSMGTVPIEKPTLEKPTLEKLTLTKQPQSVTCNVGEEVTFSVRAEGGKEPYSYKWEASATGYKWSAVSKGYNRTLSMTLSAADLRDGLQVRCTVTDDAGSSVVSESATISAAKSNLKIVSNPRSVVADEGDYVSMSVTVSGGQQPYGFVWLDAVGNNVYTLGGADIESYAETSVLTVRASAYGWAGNSSIRCMITDATGKSVTTSPVYIKVNETSYGEITRVDAYSLTGDYVDIGDDVRVSVDVQGGSGDYSYQWYCNGKKLRNGQDCDGATSATLRYHTGSNTEDFMSFYCVVSDNNAYNNYLESNRVIVELQLTYDDDNYDDYDDDDDYDDYDDYDELDYDNPW